MGNMGKVLRVDLSSGAHWDETLNSALAENYLACRLECARTDPGGVSVSIADGETVCYMARQLASGDAGFRKHVFDTFDTPQTWNLGQRCLSFSMVSSSIPKTQQRRCSSKAMR